MGDFLPVLARDLTKPLLPVPHPGKQTRNHNYSKISTRTKGAEVGREAWLDFYRPFQPMNKLLFFRSASRPIWASRCNLRLYSALFADAGSSRGGRRWRDASLFYFFSPQAFTSGSGADPDARGRRMFDLRISEEAPLCIHCRLHRWRQQRPGRRLSGQRRR